MSYTKIDANSPVKGYGSISELNAITGTEQTVAKALNEIYPFQVTRTNHYAMAGPAVGQLSAKNQSAVANMHNFLTCNPVPSWKLFFSH